MIEQIRDLAEAIRAQRSVSAIILYGSFARGDFHEGSDIDLIVVGDFRERFHKAGRQPSSASRSNRSATPRRSSPNRSGAKIRSSSRLWPRAFRCRQGHTEQGWSTRLSGKRGDVFTDREHIIHGSKTTSPSITNNLFETMLSEIFKTEERIRILRHISPRQSATLRAVPRPEKRQPATLRCRRHCTAPP